MDRKQIVEHGYCWICFITPKQQAHYLRTTRRLCLLLPRNFSHKFGFEHWRLHSINDHTGFTKPVVFADKPVHSLYDGNIWRLNERCCQWLTLCSPMKCWICSPANWSPIRFADPPAIYEHRCWVMLNDDCRMHRSIDCRQLAIPLCKKGAVMANFCGDLYKTV